MSKTLLHRLFGFGKIPKEIRPVIEQEGIILLDEGISGTVTFRNFRSPGRIHSWKKSWFTGSIVLTEQRLAAFTFSRQIINVPLDDERLNELKCAMKKKSLSILFDVSAFHEDWSGTLECRFNTPKAPLFLEHIKSKQKI